MKFRDFKHFHRRTPSRVLWAPPKRTKLKVKPEKKKYLRRSVFGSTNADQVYYSSVAVTGTLSDSIKAVSTIKVMDSKVTKAKHGE